MDAIFGEELGELRDKGRLLTEATMFADRRCKSFWRVIPMLLLLMKRLFDYATLVRGADDICIAVHPDHSEFYERRLLFKPWGRVKSYPRVGNRPAVGMRLNLHAVREATRHRDDLQIQFLDNRTHLSDLLNSYDMQCEDLEYFFIRQSDTFSGASVSQMECVRKSYPDCPWSQWGFGG
jgi:hypothetical protein